ncbi:MAG: hypothetical protein ACI8PG_004481, partial [Planctomycetota bacterium]
MRGRWHSTILSLLIGEAKPEKNNIKWARGYL